MKGVGLELCSFEAIWTELCCFERKLIGVVVETPLVQTTLRFVESQTGESDPTNKIVAVGACPTNHPIVVPKATKMDRSQ